MDSQRTPTEAAPPTIETSTSTSSRPRPRPDRSSEQARRVQTKNRRLEFLRRNPDYLSSSDREFANVALYNTLVRAFQTPAERAAEAQDSGFGHVLEASMLRNPEPLQRVDDDDVVEEEDDEPAPAGEESSAAAVEETAADVAAVFDDDDLGELDKETAAARWHTFLRNWFVDGGAALGDGFDYTLVDDDSEYDALARADAEAAWFDEESPGWVSDEGEDKPKTGETGIQDF
ncbi:hypothetical protein Sste5346_005872 [Sporothrix stenoceras]|uniref:CCD97-like C-terminal domain-containing protein n=1 Tax=Sporothrix stenoceras TaxID=5173 RepID=A0ABR3Z2E7_9PEZI